VVRESIKQGLYHVLKVLELECAGKHYKTDIFMNKFLNYRKKYILMKNRHIYEKVLELLKDNIYTYIFMNKYLKCLNY